jgi:DNA-binding transcriptional MerR regulator
MQSHVRNERPLLVSRKDAASMLGGCHPRTLVRLEKRGLLRPIRLTPGGAGYYSPENIAELAKGTDHG